LGADTELAGDRAEIRGEDRRGNGACVEHNKGTEMETPKDLNGELTERIMAALRRNKVLLPGVSSYNTAFSIVYETLSDTSSTAARIPADLINIKTGRIAVHDPRRNGKRNDPIV
jgi:hypothetical protein